MIFNTQLLSSIIEKRTDGKSPHSFKQKMAGPHCQSEIMPDSSCWHWLIKTSSNLKHIGSYSFVIFY